MSCRPGDALTVGPAVTEVLVGMVGGRVVCISACACGGEWGGWGGCETKEADDLPFAWILSANGDKDKTRPYGRDNNVEGLKSRVRA